MCVCVREREREISFRRAVAVITFYSKTCKRVLLILTFLMSREFRIKFSIFADEPTYTRKKILHNSKSSGSGIILLIILPPMTQRVRESERARELSEREREKRVNS